jgi:hypothetical protein
LLSRSLARCAEPSHRADLPCDEGAAATADGLVDYLPAAPVLA